MGTEPPPLLGGAERERTRINRLASIDLFTVRVMTLITVLIVSCAAVFSWRTSLRVPGMRLFAFGLLSISLGGAVGVGSAFSGGHLMLLAYSAFICAGVAAAAQGIRVLRGRRLIGWKFLSCGAFLAGSLFSWFMFKRDVFTIRMGITSCVNALLCADAAVSLLRGGRLSRDRTSQRATGIAFSVAAATLALRSVSTFSGLYRPSMWAAGPIEVVVTVMINVVFIACVVGVVLCASGELRSESEQMALFDPLTGLPNRRWFFDRLAAAEERAAAVGRQLGIIYTDLDGFKQINDMWGHDAGDQVLKTIGKAMARALRPGDCLARIGGDEFVVLIERAESREDLIGVAQRLKTAVEREAPCSGSGEPLRISCGLAMFPEDGDSAQALMRMADAAMYRAKREARALGLRPAREEAETVSISTREVRRAAIEAPVANG